MTTVRPQTVDLALPTIALIGRVNVGKSTLFNRIIEKKQAVESTVPGTTRTRNIGRFVWRGREARIIDAGGLTRRRDQEFEQEILEQTARAVVEADLIFLVVDIQDGLLPTDREIAHLLRPAKVPVILVTNKVDAPRWQSAVQEAEWLKLGLGTPRAVSAVTGAGIGDLLDEAWKIFQRSPQRPKKITLQTDIHVAIIGKPNVGKSTLLNQIAGEEMVITSPIAHTTREAFNLLVKWQDKIIEFIDTAGLRRRTHIDSPLEKIGASQSIRKLADADIILLMIDATDPFSAQEKRLAELIEANRRSAILVINKWDMIEDKSEENREAFLGRLHAYYHGLRHAATLFVSAKTGYRVHQLYETIVAAMTARNQQIDPHTLDAFLRKLIARQPPTRGKGIRFPRISGLKQIDTAPPTFQIMVKARTSLHSSYLRYMENAIRAEYNLVGTPVVIYAKKSKI